MSSKRRSSRRSKRSSQPYARLPWAEKLLMERELLEREKDQQRYHALDAFGDPMPSGDPGLEGDIAEHVEAEIGHERKQNQQQDEPLSEERLMRQRLALEGVARKRNGDEDDADDLDDDDDDEEEEEDDDLDDGDGADSPGVPNAHGNSSQGASGEAAGFEAAAFEAVTTASSLPSLPAAFVPAAAALGPPVSAATASGGALLPAAAAAAASTAATTGTTHGLAADGRTGSGDSAEFGMKTREDLMREVVSLRQQLGVMESRVAAAQAEAALLRVPEPAGRGGPSHGRARPAGGRGRGSAGGGGSAGRGSARGGRGRGRGRGTTTPIRSFVASPFAHSSGGWRKKRGRPVEQGSGQHGLHFVDKRGRTRASRERRNPEGTTDTDQWWNPSRHTSSDDVVAAKDER